MCVCPRACVPVCVCVYACMCVKESESPQLGDTSVLQKNEWEEKEIQWTGT